MTSIYKSYLQSDHKQPISIIPIQNIDLSGGSCLYPINSEFWATFTFTHKDDENCYKMNLYTYSSFHSQKSPCFQRIIKEGLWSYRFFLSVRPNMVGSVTEKKLCLKKNHSNSVPIWLLPKKIFIHIVKNIIQLFSAAFEQYRNFFLSYEQRLHSERAF